MSARISLVVCTLNEEAHIGDCIRSAQGLADEVLVVDMASEDKTAEIARSLGARVYIVPKAPFVDPTRNYAVSLASGEWIVLMDADERLTPALTAELRAIADGDLADVVECGLTIYMFGTRIRYSGWQDTLKGILFKKGFITYSASEVHGQPALKGRLLLLELSKGTVVHYNFRDIRHFISKMNDYTDGEALKLFKAGGNQNPLKGVYWGLRHFCRRYFLRSGYKDGRYGFIACALMGFYWFLAFCKAWELKQGGENA